MKTIYLDCGMGAAGDMLTAALYELLPDEAAKAAFLEKMNTLGIPGVKVSCEIVSRCGICGTHMTVTVNGTEEESQDVETMPEHVHEHETHEHCHEDHDHDHEHGEHDHGDEHAHDHVHSHDHDHTDHAHSHDHDHTDHVHSHDHAHHHHSSMHEIGHIVEALPVSDKVKTDVLAVYELIAEAEGHAHGVPVSQIHFHEVGTMDAVADITAVCLLMEELAPEQVVVSPVCVGTGKVRCAHGILPVPAPATADILRGVPVYGGTIRAELCTPTGAALLKHFASAFGPLPLMTVERIGYGMGKKEFEAANCVRALLGQTDAPADGEETTDTENQTDGQT